MKSYSEKSLHQADMETISFQRVLDSVLDLVCVIDVQGRFVHVNRATLSLLGYHPSEMVGHSFLEFIVPEDVEKSAGCLQVLFQRGHNHNFENRYYHKDGSMVPLLWSARWDPDDQLVYCVARDGSERQEKEKIRHQYQRSIRRRNAEIRDMLERITDGFFAMDAEWRITYINTQVEKMLSIRREDYLDKNYWEIFPEMVGTVYYEQYHKAHRERVSVHFEAWFPPFEKWLGVNAYPSKRGLSVFFRDVSEKRKVEQELHMLSLIAKNTQNMVVVTDADQSITWVNDAFTTITGYTFAEAVGQKPSQLLHGPESDPEVTCFIREELQKERPFRAEVINYTKGGQKYWSELYVQPVWDDQGKVQQYFSIQTDITERKATEEQLRRLSIIARETDNLVLVMEPDGTILWVNNAFTQKTGYTLEEVVGQHPATLLNGPETDLETDRFIQAQMKKGEPFSVELLNYTKAGEEFWVDVHAQPVFDQKGKVTQYFAVTLDITERKRLQAQLYKEQKDRQKMITAAVLKAQESERAVVSKELHDNVNQVLTTVKLYTELCLSGVEQREDLLKKSVDLLQQSIGEIRSLSKRLSAPSLGGIRMKDSVKELVDSISATGKLRITLDTSVVADLELDADLHLSIYRILQEHLTNILKHADARHVGVFFDIVDGDLTLKVMDDGKGFDTRQKRGGIGITNMTTRAESVNGTLLINSAPGLGCVLLVRFPLGL